MPYELIANGGPVVALTIFLGVLINRFMVKDKENTENYKKLVEDTMQKSVERENILTENHKEERKMLIEQLDKYNTSLKEISFSMGVIPKMQSDIEYLKERIGR